MDLKIRLPEGLDTRLRTHAENTGATLNSIICLAIDAFVPGGVKTEKVDVKAPAPEPVKVAKRVVLASKQQVPTPPKLSAKPTKDERRKLAEWHRLNAAGQRDLLDKA
jgi:hypothetical protein